MKPDNGGEKNPEILLIDRIADQIQDDERLIDGLGDGSLGFEDVEKWYERRRAASSRFLEDCGRFIGSMRTDGFGRLMRHAQKRARERGRGQALW